MKNKLMRVISLAALALSLATVSRAELTATAQAAAINVSATSSLEVQGDSTLHKWTAQATKLSISATAKAGKGDLLSQVKAGGVTSLDITVLVEGLQSNEGAKMNKNMYSNMESTKFPDVHFSLKSYEVKDGVVNAKGALTIHGVSKDIEISGTILAKDGVVTVKGSYDLLMSEYGIKPPVMMLGTVRVKDSVKIVFDYVLPVPAKI